MYLAPIELGQAELRLCPSLQFSVVVSTSKCSRIDLNGFSFLTSDGDDTKHIFKRVFARQLLRSQSGVVQKVSEEDFNRLPVRIRIVVAHLVHESDSAFIIPENLSVRVHAGLCEFNRLPTGAATQSWVKSSSNAFVLYVARQFVPQS